QRIHQFLVLSGDPGGVQADVFEDSHIRVLGEPQSAQCPWGHRREREYYRLQVQASSAARAFKYQLMPNGEQQRQMRRFAGSRRFVFNKALALQKANYEADEGAS